MDSNSEQKIRSLICQLQYPDNTEAEDISVMIQILSLVMSMDLDSEPKPKSKLMFLITQTLSFFRSMDLNSQPKPLPDLVSLISEKLALHNSIVSYSEPKLRSLISQLIALEDAMESDQESESNLESKFISVMIQIIFVVSSMDLDSQPKPESELMSLVSQASAVFNSMDLDSQPEPLVRLISLISKKISLVNSFASDLEPDSEFMSLVDEIESLEPEPELISVINQVLSLFEESSDSGSEESELDSDFDSDLEPESKLISMITELLMSTDMNKGVNVKKVKLLGIQIISLVKSMDFDSQPKPETETELMSLVSQAVSVFSSMDLDSQPMPFSKLISIITQELYIVKETDANLFFKFRSLLFEAKNLEAEPELMSLIHQILFLVMSMNSKWEKLVSFCPQIQLSFKQGERFFEEIPLRSYNKWECLYGNWEKFGSTGKDVTHFFCPGCRGKNHEEHSKAPLEIKHPLHPKHSLQLVLFEQSGLDCYCCDKNLRGAIYYCWACNFAVSIACAEKSLVLSAKHPKWHEHTLALFPSHASFTCNLCALKHSTCPFYICPPCDFVVHQRCLSLPRVIRISRHPHRISFTHSFDRGGWSCGVCRRKMDNDYGGYSCIKEGCSYAAHSKCATQFNVWDGRDLEGEPEEIEEEILEPFVRISDGIIQHFSHQHHHLTLDNNTDRDYDVDKLCKACVTPIYFGNFYYCLQCDDFILHEKCANLSRKTYNPIHPHLLTLVTDDRDVIDANTSCSACLWLCTGFFYECNRRWCDFRVHVQCATISEPLDHESHRHPLFLTSKPEDQRRCRVCNSRYSSAHSRYSYTYETFNCIEEECDFALCFGCATLPHKVRYRHDKHTLTLSYEEEASTMTLWCEVCEEKVIPEERFYKCDEYCGVTLHIQCLVVKDLYMKPHLTLNYSGDHVKVLPNHVTFRPFCSVCRYPKHCPYKYFYRFRTFVCCSLSEAFQSGVFGDRGIKQATKVSVMELG